MATITITKQILDGNMGDGWNDNHAAARAFAEFAENTWRSDLSELADAGHAIDIKIDVQRNTSGCAHGVEIIITSDSGDLNKEREIESSVEFSLTSTDVLWTKFCDSEIAERLAA